MTNKKLNPENNKLDEIVAKARQERDARELSYREKAIKMYPWVCGRCGREFNRKNLQELTVHHKDHNHDNNPEDGSNWELLCLYCHDNEHSRNLDKIRGEGYEVVSTKAQATTTHKPFADLKGMMNKKD